MGGDGGGGGGTGVCVRLIGEGGTRCVRLKGKESRGPGVFEAQGRGRGPGVCEAQGRRGD